MLELKKDYCLKNYNSFAIDAKARYFTTFDSIDALKAILNSEIYVRNKSFVLGGGTNILLTKDFDGLILHNKILGISILEDNSKFIIVEVGAGVNWHKFVEWSINKELSGIENLALIPGTVGASPIQNIGAYGMEVKETITKVHGVEISKGKTKTFLHQECKFKYRSSIFKTKLKNKIIITKVEFKLSKIALNKTRYGDIEKELKVLKLDPSPKNIANCIINIRNRKLPNPVKIGNSGSFFKNPIIQTIKFKKLKKKFPLMIGYKVSEKETKIAAGWLIDNAGYKGYRKNDAGVHENQALVLVNYANASGIDILNLADKIQKKIKTKYSINIENEVNIL